MRSVDDRHGVKKCGAVRRFRGHGRPREIKDGVVPDEVAARILPRGERLADARRSAADADIAVPAAVVAELRKALVSWVQINCGRGAGLAWRPAAPCCSAVAAIAFEMGLRRRLLSARRMRRRLLGGYLAMGFGKSEVDEVVPLLNHLLELPGAFSARFNDLPQADRSRRRVPGRRRGRRRHRGSRPGSRRGPGGRSGR
jgi:hypothetical protein